MQEPDFAENELIYEDLDLEEVQSGMYGTTAGTLSEGGGTGGVEEAMGGSGKGEVWSNIVILDSGRHIESEGVGGVGEVMSEMRGVVSEYSGLVFLGQEQVK